MHASYLPRIVFDSRFHSFAIPWHLGRSSQRLSACFTLLLGVLLGVPSSVDAQTVVAQSYAIPYQTLLRRDLPGGGQAPYQGPGYFKFVLYREVSAEGGGGVTTLDPLWSHDPNYIASLDPGRLVPVPEPSRVLPVTISEGIASILLGHLEPALLNSDGSPALEEGLPVVMPVLDPTALVTGPFRLRVWFGEAPDSLTPLEPDLPMAASPLALRAALADSVAEASISTESLVPELASALEALETLVTLSDRLVYLSDQPQDAALIDAGFIPVRPLPASPWELEGLDNVISGRVHAASAWTGTQFLVWGGALAENGTIVGGGARYNPQTRSWALINPVLAPAAREQPVSVWTGSHWLIWGGMGQSGMLADGAAYNPDANSWSAMPAAPIGFEARLEASGVWTGSQLLIFGGRSLGGALNDGVAYTPDTASWEMLGAFPGVARTEQSAVWIEDQMWVWGGRSNEGIALGDGYLYDPVAQTWEPMAAAPISGRWAACAMAIPGGVLVWGGQTSGGVLGSGALWLAESNTWEVLPSASEFLQPASLVRGVLTTQGPFLFGGFTGSAVSGSAAYLDLERREWFAPPPGGPVGRLGHAMEYDSTANQILIFGGGGPGVAGAFNELWHLPAERTQYLFRKP